MTIGACDICNAQNVELGHGFVSGLETYYCDGGCGPVVRPTPGGEISLCYLHDALTGRCLGSIGYTDGGTKWDWIVAEIASAFSCRPDQVSEIETDDGDKITADGVVVAYTSR